MGNILDYRNTGFNTFAHKIPAVRRKTVIPAEPQERDMGDKVPVKPGGKGCRGNIVKTEGISRLFIRGDYGLAGIGGQIGYPPGVISLQVQETVVQSAAAGHTQPQIPLPQSPEIRSAASALPVRGIFQAEAPAHRHGSESPDD
jgi:hypothetical protein